MKIRTILLIAFILTQSSFFAQVTIPDASPAASIKQTIGYTEVTIEYNRPSLRNRDMFEDLTREGEVWRTGANMATRLTLSDKITVGGKELSPGKYSIYSIPGKKEWTIIINRKISWGTQYDEKLDLVRIKVPTLKSKENHESFTFYFSNTTEDSAILGFVLLLYGYASKFIGIYFFWESKSLGWLVVLVLSIIILSKDVKTRKLKKSPTVGGYIGIGLISFILLIKAILIISIPISDAYSNAKTQLKEMESIVVQTGEIQGFSYRTNGAFSYSSNGTDEYGSLDMTIIIKGEAKYIEKDILIEKTPKFNWQITYMEN